MSDDLAERAAAASADALRDELNGDVAKDTLDTIVERVEHGTRRHLKVELATLEQPVVQRGP